MLGNTKKPSKINKASFLKSVSKWASKLKRTNIHKPNYLYEASVFSMPKLRSVNKLREISMLLVKGACFGLVSVGLGLKVSGLFWASMCSVWFVFVYIPSKRAKK